MARHTRRRFLQASLAGLTTLLAGCSFPGGGESGEEGDEGGEEGGEGGEEDDDKAPPAAGPGA